MPLDRRGFLAAGAGFLLAAPALAQNSAPSPFNLGRLWRVVEVSGKGPYFEGVWTRRGESNVFDARWREQRSHEVVTDVVEFRGINGEEIELYRRNLNGTYYGRLVADGRKVINGRATWYGRGDIWSADIEY